MDPTKENEPVHLEITRINNYIYLGSYEHAYFNTEELQKLDIDTIINCAKEIILPDNFGRKILHYPLEDGEYATLLEYMDNAINNIDKLLRSKKKIYLHCDFGKSRSPAILIYYLMINKNFTFDKALSFLKKIRPIISINDNFERELRAIEE